MDGVVVVVACIVGKVVLVVGMCVDVGVAIVLGTVPLF